MMRRLLLALGALVGLAATVHAASGPGLQIKLHLTYRSAASDIFRAGITAGCDARTQIGRALADYVYRRLTATGIWAKLDTLYVLAASDPCNALINWAAPGRWTLAINGTLDFNEDQGFVSDGATGYLDVGVAPSGLVKFQQNDAHAGVWALNFADGVTNGDLGLLGANGNFFTIPATASGIHSIRLNNAASVNSSRGAVGLSSSDRSSSSLVAVYRNGAIKNGGPVTSTSSARDTRHITINREGSPTNWGVNTVSFVSIGAALDDAQELALYQVERDYLVAKGTWSLTNPDQITGPNYLTADMINDVTPSGWRVVMQASPPASDSVPETDYPYYPLNVAQAQEIGPAVASTWTGGVVDQFLWVDRYIQSLAPGANPIFPPIHTSSGTECRVQFTTLALAIASTKVKVAYTIGMPAHNGGTGYLDIANDAGLADSDVLAHDAVEAQADTLCTIDYVPFKVFYDKIWLPQTRLVDLPADLREGVTLDMEPHDGRVAADTTGMISFLSSIVHSAGYKLTMYNNPLNGPRVIANGMDQSNMYLLVALCDYFNLLAWHANTEGDIIASLLNQLDLLTGPGHDQPIPYSKLMVTMELGTLGTTPDEAAAIREFMVPRGFAGIGYWRHGAVQGGQKCRWTVQKILLSLGLPDDCTTTGP